MEHTKLIAMRNDLGLGHKGDILLTTQERVDNNREPIAKDIIDEANAEELVRRWNAFEKDGLVDGLRAAADEGLAECERVKMDCKCKWKNLDSLLGRIERIEAAIAKVKD